MSELNQSFDTWSKSSTETDPVKQLKSFAGYVRAEHFKNGTYNDEVEEGIRQGVGKSLYSRNILREDSTEEEKQAVEQTLGAPDDTFDADAQFVYNQITGYAKEEDLLDQDQADVIRRYVSSRRLGLNEQADSYKDRVADIIKDPYITTKSKLGALNRGEVPVVAIVDKDGNRSLKAGPNWSEDTVRKSVDDLVSRGAIGSDDLRGVNYLLQKSAFGTSSNADVERSNEFFGDVDLLAGSDENFSGAVDAINEKRKEDEEEADKGFFGKLWDAAAEATGNLVSAAKDSVVYTVGEAKKGNLVAPLGSLGAVKEGIERRGEAENANALKQRTDIAAIIASSPIGSKYSAEEIERFSNDFVTLRSQPNYNPDKPETGIRLMSTGVPILSPAIIARKQELDKAIAATGLNAAQENVARVAATKTLEAQAPEMIRLVTSRDTDAVTAYAKAKEKGQSDADFISEWVGNDDNYDNFRNRLSSTAYSTLTGIASLAVAAPALFGNKDAAETLVGMGKGAESYSRYAEMFGDKFGVGQDIANMLPQIAIDVALSTVSGGAYALAKAGLGAAARGAAASVVKREVASLATRTAKNMMVGMSKEAAESVALAATKSEFTGSALRSVANNISTFASSKGGYLNNLAAVGPSTFLRSAGGTYSSIYSQLPESMSHEEKHQKAFGSAIAAGSFTALLTAGMSTLGAGGVESLATRDLEELTFNQVRKLYSTTRAMSSKIADKTIKEEIRKATSGAVKQFLVSGAREGGGEAFEEGVDQAFQMMVEDAALNRDTPIAEIGKNIWYAAGLGGLMGVGFNVAPQLAPTLTQKGKLNEDRKIMSARLQLFGEISGKLTDAGAPKTAEALAAVIAESNLPKETPVDTAVTPEAITELETVDWDPVSDPTTGLLADYEFSTAYFDGNGGKVMRDGAGNMILEFFKPLKTGETSVVLGDPADKASGRMERKSRIKVTKNEEGQIKAGSPVVKRGTINYALPHASYRPATKVSYNKKGKAVGLTVFRAKSIGGSSTMDIHITQEDALVETARYYGISLEPQTTEQVEAEKSTPPIEGSSKLNKERKDKQKAQIKEQRKQDATAAAEVNKTTTTKKRGKKAAATEEAPTAEAEIDVVAEPDGELPEVETVTNKGRSKIAEKILTSAGIEPSTASVVGDYIAKKVDPAGNMPTEEFREKVSEAFRAMGGSVKGDAAEYSENADAYLGVDTYGRTPAEQAEAAKAFNDKVNTDRLQKNRAIAHLIVKGGESLDVDKGVLVPSQSTILDPEIDFDYANLGQEELEQVISNLELDVAMNPESVDLAEELEEATRVYNMLYVDEEDEATSDFVEIPEEQRSSVMKALRSGAVTTVKFQYKGTVREGVVENVARTKVTIGFDGISASVNVSQIDFTPFTAIVNEEPEIEKEAPSPQSLKFAGVTLGTGTEALTPSEAAWVSEDPKIQEHLLSPQFSRLFSKNIIKDGSKRQYILENMREMAAKEGAAIADMAPVRIMGSKWFADIELAPADVSITPIKAEGATEDEAGTTEDEVDTRTVSDITKTLQRIIKPLLELKQKMDRWTSDMDNPRSRKAYAQNKDKYEQLLKSTETRYSNEIAALENAEQEVDSFDVATSFALSQLEEYVAKADTDMAKALERAAEKELNKKVPSTVDYSTRDKWDKFRTEEERQAFDLLVAHGYPVTDFRRIFNPKGIDEANPNSYMSGKRLYLRELIQEKYPTFNVPTTIEEYKAFNQSDYIKWTNAEGVSVKAPVVSETVTNREGKEAQSMVFTNDPAITMAQLEAGGTAGIFVDDKYLDKLNPSIKVANGFVTHVDPPYEQNQGQNATNASSNLNNIMDALDISSAFQEIPRAYVKVINPKSNNVEDLFNSLWVNTRDFLASSNTLKVNDADQRADIINDTVIGYTAALRMFVLASRVSDLVARSIQFKGKVGSWNYAVASQDEDGTLFLAVDPEQQTNFITNRKALKEAVSEMTEEQLRGILDAKAMSNFLVKADSIEGEPKEETLAREKVILERASNAIENTFPHLSKGMKFTGEVRHRAILSNFGMFMLQKSLGLKLFVPDADFTSRYSDFTSPPDLGKILTEVHGRHRTKKSNVKSQLPSTSFDALLTASEEGSFTLEANLREDFDTFSNKLDRMSDILGAASSEDIEYYYANTEDSLTAAAEGDPMIRALLVDLVNKLDPTTVIDDESSVSSVITALLYNVNIAGQVSGNTSYGFGAKLLVMGDAVKNLSTSTEGRKLAAYMYYLGWLPDRAQFEGMDQAPSIADVQARLETLPITRGTLRPPTKQETKKGPNELDFINDYHDSVIKITTSEEGADIRRRIQLEADHRKALTNAENFLKLAKKQRGNARIVTTEDARNLINGLEKEISHIEDRNEDLSESIRSLRVFIANADNAEFRNRDKEYANMTVLEAEVRVSALYTEMGELDAKREHNEKQIDIISGAQPFTRKVNHFTRVVESLQRGVEFYSVRKHLTEFYQGATVTPIPEPELGAPKPQRLRSYNTRTIRFGEATVADLRNTIETLRSELPKLIKDKDEAVKEMDTKGSKLGAKLQKASKALRDAQVEFNESKQEAAPIKKAATKEVTALKKAEARTQKAAEALLSFDNKIAGLKSQLARSISLDAVASGTAFDEHPTVVAFNKAAQNRDSAMANIRSIRDDIRDIRDTTGAFIENRTLLLVELNSPRKKPTKKRKADIEKELKQLSDAEYENDTLIAAKELEIQTVSKSLEGLRQKAVDLEIAKNRLDVPDVVSAKTTKLQKQITEAEGSRVPLADEAALAESEAQYARDSVAMATTVSLQEVDTAAASVEATARLEKAQADYQSIQDQLTPIETKAAEAQDKLREQLTKLRMTEVELSTRTTGRTTRASLSDTAIRLIDERIRINTQEAQEMGLNESTEKALRHIAKNGAPHLKIMANLLLSNLDIVSQIQVSMTNIDPQVAGLYINDTLVILNMAGHNGRGLGDVLIHELTHALTVNALKDPKIAKRIESLRILAKRKFTEAGFPVDDAFYRHAFSDNEEFLSAVFTDKHVQDILRNVEVAGGRSWLQRIWDAITSIFGNRSKQVDTALDELIRFVDMSAMTYGSRSASIKQRSAVDAADAAYDRARIRLNNKTMDLIDSMSGISTTPDIRFSTDDSRRIIKSTAEERNRWNNMRRDAYEAYLRSIPPVNYDENQSKSNFPVFGPTTNAETQWNEEVMEIGKRAGFDFKNDYTDYENTLRKEARKDPRFASETIAQMTRAAGFLEDARNAKKEGRINQFIGMNRQQIAEELASWVLAEKNPFMQGYAVLQDVSFFIQHGTTPLVMMDGYLSPPEGRYATVENYQLALKNMMNYLAPALESDNSDIRTKAQNAVLLFQDLYNDKRLSRRNIRFSLSEEPSLSIRAIHFSREPMSLENEVSQEERDNVFGNGFYAMEEQDEAMWSNMDRWTRGAFRNEVTINARNPLIITPASYLEMFTAAEKQSKERGYARIALEAAILERMRTGSHDALVIRGFDPDRTQTLQDEVENRISEVFTPQFEGGRTEGRFTNGADRNAIGERVSQEVAGMSYAALSQLGAMQNQIFVPPQNTLSVVAEGTRPLSSIESRIRNILPAGFNLVEDTSITQPFGVKGSTIMFNPEVAARSVEDADPELQDQILSTLIKHEIAHVAANAVMKPEDYDAVAEGLGSDIMDKVASDYYRAAYPDVAERKRAIEEDRSNGQLTDRVLAAEWFRSKVEKAVNGKSTEEVIRELKGNKTLIGTFLKYFQEFLAILRGGQKDAFSLGVAADISKASRIYEDLLNNGIPKAEPEPQEGVGHTAELIEAIRTGQGNQAFFVQPIAFADKKNTTVETVWGRISKLIRNLPADINKLVRDREGDIRAAQFLMERFAPHYKRFLEPALKAGADINDVGMILGTTAPTMDDAAITRVNVAVEAFGKTIASGTPVDEVDKLVSAEKTRALAAEKKIQDTAFLNNQKAAVARMDAIAPEFSKFLQTFRKEIDKRQDAIGYSHSAGIYLTRTYKFFNTEGWASAARDAEGATYRLNGEEINFGDLRAKAAQSYEADVIAEYAAAGMTLTPSLLTRGVQDKLDNLLKWLSENATVDKGETLSQDLRRFMPKNNVDSAVRELLGETKNPMENALRTLHYVAVLDANKKALTAIKDSLVQSGLGSDTEKAGFVQVFGTGVTKSREPLGGLFVRADIAKELEAEFGSNARKLMKHTEGVLNKVTGGLAKMSGAAMTTKTLMSIGFYTRNILSNQVVLIAAQGIIPLASSGLDLYKSYRLSGIANFESSGKKATEAELAEVQELIRLGVLRDSSSRGQFDDLMRGYADRAGVTFETAMDDIIKVASKGDLNALQNMASRAYGGLKGSVEFLAAVNSWIDDSCKAQVYFFEKSELAKAYPSNTAEWHSEQAATKVKLTMPSHSEQLDIVRSFNRNPLSLFVFPFARWKTEVLRTYVNTQKLGYREITSGNSRMFVRGLRRLAGSATVTTMGMTALNSVLAAAFRLFTGQDDEEDKDKDKNAVVVDDPAVLSALRVAFPEYQKGNSLRVTTNGRELSVIDMTAIHPYATLIDSATIIREGLATGKGVDTKKLASYFASQFVGSQIASGAVLDIVNNQNDFGQKIYEETDDSLVQVRKMITYVGAQAYKPGIVAKIQASTRKGEANPDYIWAGEFLGARPKVYTLDQVARAGFYSLKSESDSIKRQRSALSSGRAISEEDVRDIMVTTQEADDRTQARLHQFMNAMRSVGTSERVIVQRAVATGMSKKRVAEAIEGRNTTWMGSADWAKGMVDNVTQTGEDDPRARFDMISKVYKSMPPETSVRNIK